MKRIQCIVILLCVSMAVFAGENLLRNGDFTKRTNRWSGDLKILSERDNKICELDLEDDEDQSFQQEIELQEPKDLILRFKIRKSDDYTGSDEVGIHFDSEYTLMVTTRKIPDNHAWNEVVFNYTNFHSAKHIIIKLIAEQGTGTLYFDDIELTEKD